MFDGARRAMQVSRSVFSALALVIVIGAFFVAHLLFPDLINRIPQASPIDSFMGTCLTSLVGAFVGVYIALEADRRKSIQAQARHDQEKQEELYRQSEQRLQEASTRKGTVLDLHREELTFNHEALKARTYIGPDSVVRAQLVEQRLRTESWRAFSDGGELHWIDDASLIAKMAIAYHEVRALYRLEELWIEAVVMNRAATAPDLLETLRVHVPKVEAIVLDTLNNIAKNVAPKV
jgi:hypothetical protein